MFTERCERHSLRFIDPLVFSMYSMTTRCLVLLLLSARCIFAYDGGRELLQGVMNLGETHREPRYPSIQPVSFAPLVLLSDPIIQPLFD